MSCCKNLGRKTPHELEKEGGYTVKVEKHAYYTSAIATCKTCNKQYKGQDHPDYHYNYWSWSEVY